MMKREGANRKDHVQGKVYLGKKWDAEKQQFVPAKFFNIALYIIGEDGEPVVYGEKVIERKGKPPLKVPKYQIAKVFRVAESSLMKVGAQESKSCNVYFSER